MEIARDDSEPRTAKIRRHGGDIFTYVTVPEDEWPKIDEWLAEYERSTVGMTRTILEGIIAENLRRIYRESHRDDNTKAMIRLLPGSPSAGRVMTGHPETSHAVAEGIAPVTGKQRLAVLNALREAGERGLTDDELKHATGADRARTRRQELMEEHAVPIVDSGKRRKSDLGHDAVVWVLAT